MSKRKPADAIGRRNFLKGATVAGAALGAPTPAAAQSAPAAPRATPLPDMAAETMPPVADPNQQSSSGADFMLDVLRLSISITSRRRQPRRSAACMKPSLMAA
jgi:acetolactate synthase-1/2/3 large subunit